MRHIHIDVPDIGPARIEDRDLFRRLKEIGRFGGEQHHARNAPRPAAAHRLERDFAAENLRIGLAHLFSRPGLQNRIGRIADRRKILEIAFRRECDCRNRDAADRW